MSRTWVWVYGFQGLKTGMLSPRLQPSPTTDVQLKGQPVPLECVCFFSVRGTSAMFATATLISVKRRNSSYPSLYFCQYGNGMGAQYVVNIYRVHDAAVQLLWRNTENVL